jgi:polyisoprenoid-binding protein YceI
MKKSVLLSVAVALFISAAGFGQSGSKLVSTKTQIKFFSSTPAEDIEAQNTASVSTIEKSTGEVVFSVPMQGFEFKNSMMQKHFNNDNFLDTKSFPDAKLKTKISNLESIDFGTDGSYPATVKGELVIKGQSNPISESGTITVKGNLVSIESAFDITLADYGITFVEGKPSTNIAKTVKVTVQAQYQ